MAEGTKHTVVSVDRVVDAPPAALFAVVADATRHPEIDGSGQLVKGKDGAARQPYSMSNTVDEFEQDHRLAEITQA